MNPKRLALIVKLLQDNGTLTQLQEFLKSKGCAHTGIWADIQAKRIEPAIAEGLVTEADLLALLDDTEEYGEQHVFLYSLSKNSACAILDDSTLLDKRLSTKQKRDVLNKTSLVGDPKCLTIVSVRKDKGEPCSSLTIKLVEPRVAERKIDDEIDGSMRTVRYERHVIRVVSVVTLHRFGLIEIRIGSRAASSKYAKELSEIIEKVKSIIDVEAYSKLSLEETKKYLVSNPDPQNEFVRLRNMKVLRDDGEALLGAAGTDGAGLTHAASAALMSVGNVDGYCDGGYLLFISNEKCVLKREIGVTLKGMNHELSLDRQCTKAEYEYILKSIREIKKVVAGKPTGN